MRLLVLSDLHRELWREHAPRINPSMSRPDIVVLAGDIDVGARAVDWAMQTFPGLPVLYVHGNHEAYGKNLEEVQEQIAQACQESKHVHFLNHCEFRLGNVRFLGATLWTDFQLFGDDARQAAMHESEIVMADYERIRLAKQRYRKLRSTDTAQLHAAHCLWLKEKLAESHNGKTVVITHMAPSFKSVATYYASDLVSAAYASRLDDLAEMADVWIHGHMHDSFDYRIGKCRVVCNPCGYMKRGGQGENPAFDPNFIIELDAASY